MTIWADALAQYEAHLRQSGLVGDTIAGYLRDVQGFARWLAHRPGQSASADEFLAEDVDAYLRYLRQTLARSPSSVNRCLQSVRSFGRFSVRAGLRDSNPAQSVALLREPGMRPPAVLSDSEVERLITVCRGRTSRTAARDAAIIQVLLQAGVRASELVRLRLADLEMTADEVVLTVRGRGERPERRLPVTSEMARHALETYLEEPRPPGVSHLFLNRSGQPLSVRSVQQIVAGLGKEAGLEISAKTLRDTFARRLWENSGDLVLLAERLGHRRPETAVKYLSTPRWARSSTEVVGGRSVPSGL